MMRCAILISGYTRSFQETHKNLFNLIKSNKDIKFDLFISVNIEEKEIGKHKGLENTLKTNMEILKKLRPKVFHINEPVNESEEKHGQYGNLSNLFNLFTEYYTNNNVNYDLLIRTRFDNMILKIPDLKSLVSSDRTIYVPCGFFYGFTGDMLNIWDNKILWQTMSKKMDDEIKYNVIINDRFAIGNLDSMKYYFEFGIAEQKIHSFTEMNYDLKSTEGALAYHLKRNGIKIRWEEDIITKIVR